MEYVKSDILQCKTGIYKFHINVKHFIVFNSNVLGASNANAYFLIKMCFI